MTAVHITGFRGEIPRASARLLGDAFAQIARNCRLSSGSIEPIHVPEMVVANTGAGDPKTIYHYSHAGDKAFMYWQSLVDVARSPISNDARGRIFFTGDGEPRMTTQADGVGSFSGRLPHAWFVLGVVSPELAPTVTVAGGVEPDESRAYRWTWMTRYGEESGPSPAVVQTGPSDGTWQLADLQAPPANDGNITVGAGGGGTYTVQVDEVYGLSVGEVIVIADTSGVAGLNGAHVITDVDPSTSAVRFALDVATPLVGGGTWRRQAPHNLAGLKRCIYRTTGTDKTYRRVAMIDSAVSSYDDTVSSLALAVALESAEWEPPPKDLHSLIVLPNGCLAGLSGNMLCLSEPYRPHAWPQKYRINLPASGVALGSSGNNVIVLTDAWPYMVTASNPAVLSPVRMQTYAPCVAKAGVVDTGGGLLYPSHDGLYLAEPGGVQNITLNLFRREDWRKMFPESFVAAFHSQRYYARHKNVAVADSVMVLDLAEPDSIVDVKLTPSAMMASPIDGELYLAKQTELLQWDKPASTPMQMVWRSKLFAFPGGPASFAVAQVRGKFVGRVAVDVTAHNLAVMAGGAAAVHGSILDDEILVLDVAGCLMDLQPPRVNESITFSILDKDGVVIWSTNVTDDQPFRIADDVECDACSFQVASTFTVEDIVVAETMADLWSVPA